LSQSIFFGFGPVFFFSGLTSGSAKFFFVLSFRMFSAFLAAFFAAFLSTLFTTAMTGHFLHLLLFGEARPPEQTEKEGKTAFTW